MTDETEKPWTYARWSMNGHDIGMLIEVSHFTEHAGQRQDAFGVVQSADTGVIEIHVVSDPQETVQPYCLRLYESRTSMEKVWECDNWLDVVWCIDRYLESNWRVTEKISGDNLKGLQMALKFRRKILSAKAKGETK